ncbi:MAG: site-specific integrase [Ignavibacteriales bacterium]|nr:site-specific integrase [Ignavibacteriales bacterium]
MSVKLRKRELPSKRIQLYLDIYRDKENRWTESLNLFLHKNDRFQNRETLKQAEEIAAKRQLDFQADQHGLSGTHKRKASFIKYLHTQADERTKPNTKASWECAIGHFADFAGEGIVFGNVTPQLLDNFKSYLLNHVKSPNSAHTYLSRIKTALNQAVKDNILPRNPANGTVVQRKETLPVHLSIKEIRKLAKTPCGNDQVKQAFLFSCFSGLRYSDVDRLTWDKIKGEYLEFTQKKTGAPERFPLSAQALQILAKQKKAKPSPNLQREIPANSVFLLPSASGVNKDLKHWAKVAGIDKPLTFHKGRHSFATLALTSGVDIFVVSKLLGHKSISQTQVYGQIIDDKKRRAVNRLPRL